MTRANAEFLIVAELSGLMSAAGMAITVVGTNAHLNGPIGKALMLLGYTVADLVLVTSADVAQVTVAQSAKFIDLMILCTLETFQGWFASVDITVGPRSEKLSQLAEQVERRIKLLQQKYGYAMATVEAGYLTLDFSEHGDEVL